VCTSIRRLTYVSKSHLPSRTANSVHVMKMAQAFCEHDIAVQLIGIKGPAEFRGMKDIFDFYGVKPLFRIRTLRVRHTRVGMAIYALSSVLLAWWWKSDLLYTRHRTAALVGTLLGLRCVLEIHHPGSYRAVRWYFLISRQPRLVVITETLRLQILADLRCEPEAVIVVPDGADPIGNDLEPSIPRTDLQRIRAGYLGHLYRGKGMEVIECLARECPQVEFLIVGGTKNDVEFWRERMGSLSNVNLYGFVPHKEVAGILRSFDVALLPNQDEVFAAGLGATNISPWASPLKAFEYMAAGLPIVASDLPNLREVFQNGENAILCPPTDIGCWRKALTRLCKSSELRSSLGERARQDFEAHYSWGTRARRLIAEIVD
jgi:glycosyltransferase involved in cell wall biosynthesis